MGGRGGDRLLWAAVSAPVLRELWAVPGRVGSGRLWGTAVGFGCRAAFPAAVRGAPFGASIPPSRSVPALCAVRSPPGAAAVRCGAAVPPAAL